MRLLVAIACVLLIPAPVPGQENDDHREPDSPQQHVHEVAGAAARTSEAKSDFVAALRRFVEGLPGGYDDDGPRVRAAVGDMNAALARWDGAIRQLSRRAERGRRQRRRPRSARDDIPRSRVDDGCGRSVSSRDGALS